MAETFDDLNMEPLPGPTNTDIGKAIVEQSKAIKDLVTSGERITKGSLGEYLTPELMLKRGFGVVEGASAATRAASWRNPKEFGNGPDLEKTYQKWIESVYTLILPYEQVIDASVRTEINRLIKNEDDLTIPEKKRLISQSSGLYLVNNMHLNFMGCGGDVNAWTATPDKGGMVSSDESDRLAFEGFSEQLKMFPGMGRTMELLDAEVILQISNEDFSMDDFVNGLDRLQINLDGQPTWKVNAQKQLALMWYRMLGFPDIRKFAYINKVYGEKMPAGERLIKTNKRQMDQYKEATKSFTFDFGYISPYYFLMDPCTLVAGILKNYPELIADIRVRMKNDSSPHNIFNFGWRPPAWHIMEKMTGRAITTSQLNNLNLGNFVPSGLTGIDNTGWDTFLKDSSNKGLLQKHAIKFAEKAEKSEKKEFMGQRRWFHKRNFSKSLIAGKGIILQVYCLKARLHSSRRKHRLM